MDWWTLVHARLGPDLAHEQDVLGCVAVAAKSVFDVASEITDRDAYRLVEPEMSKDEYAAYFAAWWRAFPCTCTHTCRCQGPPPERPRRVRIRFELPDEPPALTPEAARVLLRILEKAAARQQAEGQ